MTTRFRVPVHAHNRCLGLKMYDGTTYQADRSGLIHVENPDHARAIKHDQAIAGDVVECQALARSVPSTTCQECGFSAYLWQKTCPRCGGTINKEENP